MKRSQGFRKRPHILPPLASVQGSIKDPVDPLQPPNIVPMEPRFGSPTPRWHRPSAEDLETFRESSDEGKPSIRVTFYDHEGNPADGRDTLDRDLRNDPHFRDDESVFKGRRKDSLINFFRDDRSDRFFNEPSTKRNACGLRNFNFDPGRPTQGCHPQTDEISKEYKVTLKPMQLPNRYAPLKPIGKRSIETKKHE